MSEKINPKIEDEMNEKLKGEVLQNALDFIAFLRTNDLSLEPGYTNWFKYLNETVCVIMINGDEKPNGSWNILYSDGDVCEPQNFQVDEELKEFAQANVFFCENHGCPYMPGTRKMILGKEYDNVCHHPLWFFGPGSSALVNIKRLIEMRKQNITEMQPSKSEG